eukprot:gene9127-biopygen12190
MFGRTPPVPSPLPCFGRTASLRRHGLGARCRRRCGKSPPWVAQVVVEQYIGMECAPLEQHIGMKWRRRRCGKQYIVMSYCNVMGILRAAGMKWRRRRCGK